MNSDHVMKINRACAPGAATGTFPIYTMRDGFLFRTVGHPMGWSEHPDYRLGEDGKLYRTKYHLHGMGRLPEYEFGKDGKLYRTENHLEGRGSEPDFEIVD
ncbi:MAG: hypothetical protein JEZ12_15475 [Desulfobacterium sp.]|nr:hypothetical protein [Desulfobacterium sp.]